MARGVAAMLGRRGGPAFRRWLSASWTPTPIRRAVRYWRLVSSIQGRDEVGFAARTADHAWLMAALHHHTATRSIAPVGTATSG